MTMNALQIGLIISASLSFFFILLPDKLLQTIFNIDDTANLRIGGQIPIGLVLAAMILQGNYFPAATRLRLVGALILFMFVVFRLAGRKSDSGLFHFARPEHHQQHRYDGIRRR